MQLNLSFSQAFNIIKYGGDRPENVSPERWEAIKMNIKKIQEAGLWLDQNGKLAIPPAE